MRRTYRTLNDCEMRNNAEVGLFTKPSGLNLLLLVNDMSSITNMNIILGQGSAVKEVHNVKKQNLEVNQQYVVQHVEDKKKEDKDKIHDFEKSNRIDTENDNDKEKKKGKKSDKRRAEKEKQKQKNHLVQSKIIDIRV